MLVFSGYYAAVIFQGKTDAGEVHAEDAAYEDEYGEDDGSGDAAANPDKDSPPFNCGS